MRLFARLRPSRLPPPAALAVVPVIFSTRAYLLITLGISVAFGLLILPASVLPRPHVTLSELLLRFSNVVLFFEVQFGLHYLLRYHRNPVQRWLGRRPVLVNGLLRLSLALLAVSGYSVARYYLDPYVGLRLDNSPLLSVLLVAEVLTMIGAFFQVAIELVERSRYLAIENETLKHAQLQARYESLKQQLSPHFLFNSLSTLTELIYEEPEAATLFVTEMAHVYRYLLHHGEQAAVLLSDELRFVRAYLYLLHMRFEEGLEWQINLPESVLGRLVPPLALQLLVENAVKHNAVSPRQPLQLHIEFVAPNRLLVRNTIQPRLLTEPSSGLGLGNLASRVQLLTQQPLVVEQTPEEFRVYLPIPA